MTRPTTPAANIPVAEATAVSAYAPVTLEVPGRRVPLQLRVSAPESGDDLPVLLFSHGHGGSTFLSSYHGYGPLVDFWAARGFVVIQPTHLDSGALGLREADDPDAPLYWRSRADDLRAILDRLETIESAVPWLGGRVDHTRVAVAGHSLGGFTGCLLLGTRVTDPGSGEVLDLSDRRVATGVLFAPPGSGADLNTFAAENYPVFRHPDFSTMTAPALVVAGDLDQNDMFCDRVSYRWDAYRHAPGPKSLLTMFHAEHQLGGISGYDAAEATDENPERVATVRALAWAYLRSTLYPDDPAWTDAVAALEAGERPIGEVVSK